LRSCSSPSSPSSSGAVSGSNGFEAVSNGWYSLAIKPEKMRNQRVKKRREPGQEPRKKDRTRGGGKRENRGEKNWKSWGFGPENQRKKKEQKHRGAEKPKPRKRRKNTQSKNRDKCTHKTQKTND